MSPGCRFCVPTGDSEQALIPDSDEDAKPFLLRFLLQETIFVHSLVDDLTRRPVGGNFLTKSDGFFYKRSQTPSASSCDPDRSQPLILARWTLDPPHVMPKHQQSVRHSDTHLGHHCTDTSPCSQRFGSGATGTHVSASQTLGSGRSRAEPTCAAVANSGHSVSAQHERTRCLLDFLAEFTDPRTLETTSCRRLSQRSGDPRWDRLLE